MAALVQALEIPVGQPLLLAAQGAKAATAAIVQAAWVTHFLPQAVVALAVLAAFAPTLRQEAAVWGLRIQ